MLKGGTRRRRRRASRRADVVDRRDGRIVAVGDRPRAGPSRGARLPPAASWPPASSTSTPTSASPAGRRPRRSRPGSRAAALGGFTAVVAMPNTEPAIDSAAVVRQVLELGRPRRCATCTSPAPSPSAGPASGWRRWPRWPPSACGSSPTTAPACRTTASCAGRWSTPAASGSTLAQHCEDERAGRRRPHARGGVVEPPRHPRAAGRGRGADGRSATSPSPASPGARVHFQHLSTAGSVELVRAAKASGPAGHRRGDHPPLHAHRRRAARPTTPCSR